MEEPMYALASLSYIYLKKKFFYTRQKFYFSLIQVYKYVKLLLEYLNSGPLRPYSAHFTSTYTYGVTIIPSVHGSTTLLIVWLLRV